MEDGDVCRFSLKSTRIQGFFVQDIPVGQHLELWRLGTKKKKKKMAFFLFLILKSEADAHRGVLQGSLIGLWGLCVLFYYSHTVTDSPTLPEPRKLRFWTVLPLGEGGKKKDLGHLRYSVSFTLVFRAFWASRAAWSATAGRGWWKRPRSWTWFWTGWPRTACGRSCICR